MTVDMEFEGKTIDIAAEEACNKLNIKREDLHFDVLSYGSPASSDSSGAKKREFVSSFHRRILLKATKM